MSKKAAPHFPFYPDDWIGGTRHLTHFERSCYLELLLYQFTNGAIPGSAMRRMALCQITDLGQWQNVWEALADKFEPDDDGNLQNPKMAEIREKAMWSYHTAIESGKRGAEKRWNRDPIRDPTSDPNSNQNQNQNQNQRKNQEEEPPISPPLENDLVGCSQKVRELVEAWLAYKTERRQSYKPRGRKALITHMRTFAENAGEAELERRVNRAMASNYQGWDHEPNVMTPQKERLRI